MVQLTVEIDWKCEHQQANVSRGILYTYNIMIYYMSNTHKHKHYNYHIL